MYILQVSKVYKRLERRAPNLTKGIGVGGRGLCSLARTGVGEDERECV
jgi:hypothetical protein